MNDNHTIHDDMSFDDIAESINSITRNDTMQEGSTTAQNAESSQQDSHVEAVNLNATQRTSTQTQYVRRYSHHSGAELCKQRKPIDYLIKGYMRKGGLGMIYGESGCGKSFTVLDLAASVASEEIESWHGIKLHHGPVVYFAGEGADGLNARLACWCSERNINPDSLQLEIFDEVFKLDCGNEDKEHSLETTIAEIKATFPEPALVIFDTVNIYMKAEENSNSEVGRFCLACRKIIQELGCTVWLVHHTGLNTEAKNRARGASALKGAMDFELQLKKSDTLLTLSTPKIKDGKEQPDLPFNLTQHTIPGWLDEDGEPVTSCTIELATKLMQYRETMQTEKQKPKLKPAQQFAVDSFKEAAKLHGEIITDNPDTGHEVIRLEDSHWRDYVFETLPSTNEDTKKDKGNKRVKFHNAKKYMTLEAHMLTIHREGGKEYYCLDLSGDTEPTFRAEIRNAIKQREEAENNTSEGERTGTLF